MEEKILKKLDDMSSQFQLQLQEINQRFDKVDKKIEETEEKIITTLREEFDQKLENTKENITKEMDKKIKTTEENITKEIDQKVKTTEENITDNITKEIDRRLKITEERIIKDASKALRENIDFLYDKKNEEHEKIENELREHKERTLKGVKALEKVLTA